MMHPVSMLKYVTFDLALPCSSMSKITRHEFCCFCCFVDMLNKSTEKVRGIVREENLIFTNLEQSNITHRHRHNIILQRTRPCTKLYCSDEITLIILDTDSTHKHNISVTVLWYITAFHTAACVHICENDICHLI